jgi:hypothetical protein
MGFKSSPQKIHRNGLKTLQIGFIMDAPASFSNGQNDQNCFITGEIDMSNINWEQIRKGHFAMTSEEYRIPCASIQAQTEMLNAIGGRRSWNPDIGDYIGINKNHPLWADVCKMKS